MGMKPSSSAKDAKPQGDEGDGPLSRKDLRLTAKALAESWPVPAKLRSKVVKSLEGVLDDPEASPRDIATASKALIAASRINLQSIVTAIAADDHEEVRGRLEEVERAIAEDRKRGTR